MKIEAGDIIICKIMRSFDSGGDSTKDDETATKELTEMFKDKKFKVLSTKSKYAKLPIEAVILGGDVTFLPDLFFFGEEDVQLVGAYKTELYKTLNGDSDV